jgi:UDPglucose 6-dehydrogenase
VPSVGISSQVANMALEGIHRYPTGEINMDVSSLSRPDRRRYKIAVLGLGHVGLPTALGFSSLGWDVIGADEDAAKVDLIRAGKPPFFEPGLDDLLNACLSSGRFRVSSEVVQAIRAASVVFICVGTPQREDGAADLSQIEAISRTIGRNLNGYKLVVEKSTVPAITALWIKRTIERYSRISESDGNGDGTASAGHQSWATEFDVASNPEFLQEGKAVEDFFHPHRIVVGADSERARAILQELYSGIQCPVVVSDVTTAELIKHAANAFLSTKISFINMVADVCDAVGADVTRVAEGLGLDPRIGPGFLQAGIGFGGYCFPKDLRAFARLAEQHRADCSLLRDVEHINLQRVEVFLNKVRNALWVLSGKTLGVLGLAFKPQTDDIREAPSLKIVSALLKEGAQLRLHDPWAVPAVRTLYAPEAGRTTYCESPYEVARGAEALLLLTEWDEYRHLDLNRLRDLMQVPVLVDGRNLFDPDEVRAAGFSYVGMGRKGGRPEVREVARAAELRSTAQGQGGLGANLRA